jgi:N,N'-diacetyllegionaminate synthase
MNPWKGKHGPLLIAEIGGNHEGNYEYALQLAELAIASDSDYIKFQLYTGDTLVSRVESPIRNQHFKKFELSREQYISIAEFVKSKGKKFMASVWDLDMLDWIDPYMDVYKIGSGDLTAFPILKEFAKRGKPMIISTGLSTLNEVLETVAFVQKINPIYKQKEYLAILQCTSMYPIPYEDANLNVMNTLKDKTGLTIGYSDHTVDSKALQYAYAMGAEVLEFHFTDTKEGKEFRDHKVSLTKSDVSSLIEELKIISQLKGSSEKTPTAIEVENDHVTSFRRAAYLNKDVPAGYTIKLEDLVFLRPNAGTDARGFENMIGKASAEPIKAFEKISSDKLK